jgi:large subunit ribosomal protein L24
MQRLRVGDQVAVIRGNHKGKRGRISRIVVDKDAVVVEGVNIVKRHVKATPQKPGGILEVEAPLHQSKVMLIDPQTDKPTRVSYKSTDGKKQRIAKSGAEIVGEQK